MSEVHASIRFYHREASAEVVTDLLKVTPTRTQRAAFDADANAHQPNGWFLTRDVSGEDASLEEALRGLLLMLASNAANLAQLRTMGWRTDAFCSISTSDGAAFFQIADDVLRQIGLLGLSLNVMVPPSAASTTPRDDAGQG